MDIEENINKYRCIHLADQRGNDKLCRALEKLKELLEEKECKYIRQNDDWIVYQCSNCKMDWVFEDDEPKDSEFNYCPKCGARIIESIELEEE